MENEAVLDRMAERLVARPELMDDRRNSVEHPFGTIKQWMNQGAFLMRRLENVRAEFSLTTLAYNIRRALTLVGVTGLMAALQAEITIFVLPNTLKVVQYGHKIGYTSHVARTVGKTCQKRRNKGNRTKVEQNQSFHTV